MQILQAFKAHDPQKPYDFCVKHCPFMNAGKCDGPNFLCVGIPRLSELCRLRKEQLREKDPKKWTNAYIADQAGVSRTTVDRFLAGSINDLMYTTASQIVEVLVDGSWGQHPCPMESIYSIIEENGLEKLIDDFEAKKDECFQLSNELEKTKTDLQSQIDFLKDQLGEKDKQITTKDGHLAERAAFMVRKDKSIKWLGRFLIGAVVLLVAALVVIAILAYKLKG